MSTDYDEDIRAAYAEGVTQHLRAVPPPRMAEAPADAPTEGGDTHVSAEADSGPVSDGWVLDVAHPTLDPARAATIEGWAALKARHHVAATLAGKSTRMTDRTRDRWAERAPLWCRGRALGGIGFYAESGLNLGDVARQLAEAALSASASGAGVTLPPGTTVDFLSEAVAAGWQSGADEPMLPMAANDPRRPRRGNRLRAVLPTGDEMASQVSNTGGGTHVGEIVEFARESWEFGNDNGQLFAVPRRGPRITTPVGTGQSFRRHLTRRLFDEVGRSFRAESYSTALDILRASAEEAESTPTDLRVGPWGEGTGVVLDLGRADGQVVEIDDAGWRITTAGDEHPLFRRPKRIQPLPLPVAGGDGLAALRSILGLSAKENLPQFRLVVAWLVTALLHPAEDVPLLFWSGPEGTGKTTRAGIVISILDPREHGARRMRGRAGQLGRSTADILIAAADRYVVSLDNISTLSVRQSDVLCGIVTGATHDGRALYTDDESMSIAVQRATSITGRTVPLSAGGDLLDRMIEIVGTRMTDSERLPAGTVWRRFHDAHAEILGAILDLACEVLAVRAAVEPEMAGFPRMATHGLVCKSLDRLAESRGETGGYLDAYLAADVATKTKRINRHPLLGALASLLDETDGGTWTGTATALLNRIRPENGRQADGTDWPSNGKSLSELLADSAPMLDAAGIAFTRNPRTAAGRTVTVTRFRFDDD